MAGDWLKIERALSDKPEVWAIAAALEREPDAIVGKLIRIWGWFDEQTEAGRAPSVSRHLLDARVGVPGFCAAMIAAGWMADDGATLTLPNFERHNGKTAKNRALTAKRVAAHKRREPAGGEAGANAAGVSPALARKEKRRGASAPGAPASGAGGQRSADLFARWYRRYPNKKAKQAARRAWAALAPDRALTARLIRAVRQQQRWRAAVRRARPDAFVPEWKHPASWLRAGCWEDELDWPERRVGERRHNELTMTEFE